MCVYFYRPCAVASGTIEYNSLIFSWYSLVTSILFSFMVGPAKRNIWYTCKMCVIWTLTDVKHVYVWEMKYLSYLVHSMCGWFIVMEADSLKIVFKEGDRKDERRLLTGVICSSGMISLPHHTLVRMSLVDRIIKHSDTLSGSKLKRAKKLRQHKQVICYNQAPITF